MSYKKVLLTAPKGYRFDKTVDGNGNRFWYMAEKDGNFIGTQSFNISPETTVKVVKK